MKIKLNSLKLKNFLSFGNKLVEYVFEENKVVAVKGVNQDKVIGEENTSSNGSGKSTLMQAIVYALYGKGVDEQTKQDEYINFTNEKDLLVELDFHCDQRHVRIVRTRKPNAVELYIDGDNVTRDSVANTNSDILRLIGIKYDAFLMSFLMTTAVTPLLRRKPSEQRNFMEDLLGMNVLTERAKAVKVIRDDLTVDHKVLSRDVENADKINTREKELEESNAVSFKDFQIKRQQKIEDAKDTIESYSDFVEKADGYRTIINEMKSAEQEVSAAKTMLADSKDNLNKLERKRNDLDSQINERGSALKSKKDQLKSAQSDVETAKEELKRATARLKELEEPAGKVDSYTDCVEDIKIKTSELGMWDRPIAALQKEIDKLRSEISHLEDESCPYCRQQWANDDVKKKIASLWQTMNEKTAELKNSQSSQADIQTNIDYLNQRLADIGITEEEANQITADVEKADDEEYLATNNLSATEERVEKLQYEISELESRGTSALETKLADVFRGIEEATAVVREAEIELNDVSRKLEVKREAFDAIPFESIPEIDYMVKDYNTAVENLEKFENEKNPFVDPDEYKGKYVDVEEIKKQLEDLEVQITHCKYLHKLLTDSKSFIRKNIIGNYIPYLNKMINTYADKLDSSHICEIDSDLTVSIEYMRKTVRYNSLSAGERLKLDVSVSLALRDLMSIIGIKSDLLMVDELFDSALDVSSKKNVFNLIKDRFATILLVSHTSEFDDKCDSVLKVVKENGFSRLETSNSI